uniref:Protein kinase domain-containing protein n=1 Tax=Chromera velia CCMP2878 TaxID=1169474 RepID=A0A0G4F5B7_9ALVE|eukprot:Cvel_2756.t1-p1 / transcript=Cvel_2756.t1 / gene=Cvel_2756 / organism=Chromera_velia_CCMP2878 / gene_product=hypothetical protein / transcript_product=hypothetical protein / location=Cvel_scaffold110:121864-123736(+) / protein_length=201 / sequence_SO=supercontig / SO=protein_coding / is_pseudo=false
MPSPASRQSGEAARLPPRSPFRSPPLGTADTNAAAHSWQCPLTPGGRGARQPPGLPAAPFDSLQMLLTKGASGPAGTETSLPPSQPPGLGSAPGTSVASPPPPLDGEPAPSPVSQPLQMSLEHMEEEAEVLQRVQGDGVVVFMGSEKLPEGRAYIAIEHVQHTLDKGWKKCGIPSLPPLLASIGDASLKLHGRGFVHRDIK